MNDFPGPGEPDSGPEHDHEHMMPPLQSRNLWECETTDGSDFSVDHLYLAPEDIQPCPRCGGQCISAGLVGLVIDGTTAVLTPDEALLLANRLTRGANLVLEALEDLPDIEREAARFSGPPASQS